jgi:hypothetical protein
LDLEQINMKSMEDEKKRVHQFFSIYTKYHKGQNSPHLPMKIRVEDTTGHPRMIISLKNIIQIKTHFIRILKHCSAAPASLCGFPQPPTAPQNPQRPAIQN